MLVIVKRTLLFRGPNGEKYLAKADSDVQAIPDWIGKLPEFKIAQTKGKNAPAAITIAGPARGSVVSADRERLIGENRELKEKLAIANNRIAELEATIKVPIDGREIVEPEIAKAARQGSKK